MVELPVTGLTFPVKPRSRAPPVSRRRPGFHHRVMARQIAGRAAIEGFIGGDWTARRPGSGRIRRRPRRDDHHPGARMGQARLRRGGKHSPRSISPIDGDPSSRNLVLSCRDFGASYVGSALDISATLIFCLHMDRDCRTDWCLVGALMGSKIGDRGAAFPIGNPMWGPVSSGPSILEPLGARRDFRSHPNRRKSKSMERIAS
jgi:hypothetical protein